LANLLIVLAQGAEGIERDQCPGKEIVPAVEALFFDLIQGRDRSNLPFHPWFQQPCGWEPASQCPPLTIPTMPKLTGDAGAVCACAGAPFGRWCKHA